MRVSLLALLTAALLVSGCFGGDDEATPPDTDATPPTDETPTTPTNGTGGNGTGPTPTTPTNGNETDDGDGATTPTATEVYSKAGFNFARAPADTTETFEVEDKGFTTLTLNVTFTPTGLGASDGVAVTITGPEGGTVSCPAPATLTEAEVCTQTVDAEVGEWTVTYSGGGTMTADVSVVAS